MFDKTKNRIIVTGGSGFVGSHTMRALEELKYIVLNYDLKENLDIRHPAYLEGIIQKGDKVLHLAAIARFAEADKDPLLAYETNVEGTENVAKACELKGAERLVYASTGSVYMPIEQEGAITEDFKRRGNSPYGCSKCLGELKIEKICKSTPWIHLRYAHLFGEGKLGHGAIGGFIDRMNRGLAPILYGGKQSNDFTYIEDIVQANVLALETENLDNFGQAYNIGTGEELTTEDVFNQLKEFFGYNVEFERLPQRTVDASRFWYDISKAKEKLGYDPKFTFKQGMEKWFNK